jgi:hypothetical protein
MTSLIALIREFSTFPPPLPCLVGKDELFSKTDARLQNNVIDTTDTGKGYESGEKDGHHDTT